MEIRLEVPKLLHGDGLVDGCVECDRRVRRWLLSRRSEVLCPACYRVEGIVDVVPGGTEFEPRVKSGCLSGCNPRRSEYNSLLWTEVELNKKASTPEDKSRPCSAGVRLD